MSQGQPRSPQAGGDSQQQRDPIKYGDVFSVSGELVSQPVLSQDAAVMQSAETRSYGQTQKGGPAAAMQSAADTNERAGLTGHFDTSDVAGDQGVTVTEVDTPGARVFTESAGGQVVGQHVDQPTPVVRGNEGCAVQQAASISIGEALEATAQAAGDKSVDQSDAAAIQAAEVRATGCNVMTLGGVASTAQSAAALNTQIERDEDKVKLADVLTNATVKLPADKTATRQDAEGVVSAELRNNPNLSTHPGGVAAAVTAAARLNERTGGS
ncbi:hypothetical protein Ancab_030378 [Ancistrocladus abbreviatus]